MILGNVPDFKKRYVKLSGNKYVNLVEFLKKMYE